MESTSNSQTSLFRYFPFLNTAQATFVLCLLGVVLYINTLKNEYALDDAIVIHQNNFVLKGVRGIKDIFSKDVYYSFYERMNAKDQLFGGRYRPLTVATYALEQELIGTYRTGHYDYCYDRNKNETLDDIETKDERGKYNYEYNVASDVNKDGKIKSNECVQCWDLNKNFKQDFEEDLNQDSVLNEIDCQVKEARLRHLTNVILYILLCVAIYIFLNKFAVPHNKDLAFIIALIFLAHPIHTEVVANVKGRQEILSLLFTVLTLVFGMSYLNSRSFKTLLFFCLSYSLALFSQEQSLLLLILYPLSVFVFTSQRFVLKKLIWPIVIFITGMALILILDNQQIYIGNKQFYSFALVALLCSVLLLFITRKESELGVANNALSYSFMIVHWYSACRAHAVSFTPGVPDNELLNNPYYYASSVQEVCTQLVFQLKYIALLIFPKNLVSDYSWGSFHYKDFSNVSVYVAIILLSTLLFFGVKLSRSKHVIGFAILLFLIFSLYFSGLFFPIGTTMGERLMFSASFGFSIVLGVLIIQLIEKMSVRFLWKRVLLFGIVTSILCLYGFKTVSRNRDWCNDVTLFLKDVNTQPNSVIILGNAGARWIDLADTKEITGITLPGEDPNRFNDYNGTLHISEEELALSGLTGKKEVALKKGIGFLETAVKLHPQYVNGYLNLGLAHYKLGEYKTAIFYWKNAEVLYPDNPYLKNYYYVSTGYWLKEAENAMSKSNWSDAIATCKLLLMVDSKNTAARKICFDAVRNQKME